MSSAHRAKRGEEYGQMKTMRVPSWLLLPTLFLVSLSSFAQTSHYVAPNGRPSGDGSIGNPWDLDTAIGSYDSAGNQINPPASVQPGDTIWLRGGTYHPASDNGFFSRLVGTSGSPIKVRNYNGERVTLDGGAGAYVLAVYGSYTWFWGIEAMSSSGSRTTSTAGSGANPVPYGVAVYGPGCKFINMIVHDTAQGFSGYNASPDAEFYGNLSYYNGWIGPDRNHGHGMYIQNITGNKLIQDNIVGNNSDEGLQVYGSGGASLINITVDNNTFYMNSSFEAPKYQYNFLIGGGSQQIGNSVTNNKGYFPPAATDVNANVGGYDAIGIYTPGSSLTATGNVFVGGLVGLQSLGLSGPVTFTGNTIVTSTNALQMVNFAQFPGNTTSGFNWNNNQYFGLNNFYTGTYDGNNESGGTNMQFAQWQANMGFDANSSFNSSAPNGKWVTVRPNKYEGKRANITIYNWDLSSTVAVDVSNVLSPGDSFVVQDAQNFFGSPVLSGVYSGGTINIPMTGTTMAQTIGLTTPAHTSEQFGVFVVMVPGANAPPTQGPLQIDTTSLLSGNVGSPYSAQFYASGGSVPYVYTMTGSNVFSINSSTGVITGSPLSMGTYPETITVTDHKNAAVSGSFQIVVNAALPGPAGQFSIGDTVQVVPSLTTGLGVRLIPDTSTPKLASEYPPAQGVVVAGPVPDQSLTPIGPLCQIRFANETGWSVCAYLFRVSQTTAPLPPTNLRVVTH